MCWLTCPRIRISSSRPPYCGLSSIGSSTAGNGRHQPFSFPTLCFCRCSMLGTYHSLIGRRGNGLRESWLLATTEASVSRYKKKQVSGAARGGELVHLVSLVYLACVVRRTRETRQTRAPDRLPGICRPPIRRS